MVSFCQASRAAQEGLPNSALWLLIYFLWLSVLFSVALCASIICLRVLLISLLPSRRRGGFAADERRAVAQRPAPAASSRPAHFFLASSASGSCAWRQMDLAAGAEQSICLSGASGVQGVVALLMVACVRAMTCFLGMLHRRTTQRWPERPTRTKQPPQITPRDCAAPPVLVWALIRLSSSRRCRASRSLVARKT